MWPFVLGSLTVVAADGCPNEGAIVEKLGAQGATVPPATPIEVRLRREGEVWVATVLTADAAPRRIEDRSHDCSTLADATVALLTILLDEHARPAPAPPPPAEEGPHSRGHVEAYLATSHGIVASFAAGVGAGVHSPSVGPMTFGLGFELWPAREHPVADGRVSLSAWTLALGACANRRVGRFGFAMCALGHAGLYALSAEGYPVIRDESRLLAGFEGAGRIAFDLGAGLGLFARGGVWAPFTPLDVTVAGAESGYETTRFGPKGALGLELRR